MLWLSSDRLTSDWDAHPDIVLLLLHVLLWLPELWTHHLLLLHWLLLHHHLLLGHHIHLILQRIHIARVVYMIQHQILVTLAYALVLDEVLYFETVHAH